MIDVSWAKSIEKLENYIFKIMTPTGSGTGFLISLSGSGRGMCGVATAYHVIRHEYDWEEPIKVKHYKSGKQKLLKKSDRAIFIYPDEELAFILFLKEEFDVPDSMLSMIPPEKYVRQGVQMGWCGFPYIAPLILCFFTGHVSSYIPKESYYLVDGVAINGVSGGPAFTVENNTPQLCGVVSAYIANRATGETLPGVCMIRDVAPYQKTLAGLASMDEAKETAKEIDTQQESSGTISPESEQPPSKKPPKKKVVKKKKLVKKKLAKKKVAKKKVAKKKVVKNVE